MVAFASAVKTALAAASIVSASAIPYPSESAFFLQASVTGPLDTEPSVDYKWISHRHSAPCKSDLIFGESDMASKFRHTGNDRINAVDFTAPTNSSGISIHPGGTATVPSSNVVQLDCFSETLGLVGGISADGKPTNLSWKDGAWMACPASVLDGDSSDETIVLSYKKAGQRTLQGCADVALEPRPFTAE